MRPHRADGDLNAALLDHAVGPGEQAIEHGEHVGRVIGIEDQRPALFDQRPGQRLMKLALGQLDDLDLTPRCDH